MNEKLVRASLPRLLQESGVYRARHFSTSMLVFLVLTGWGLPSLAKSQTPVSEATNFVVRVMAANLTDNSQTYQEPALRIFQGLKPDIVAIQEFNFRGNTSNDFRAMVSSNFGPEFVWYRETGYSIPNGIISRWPIRAAGSWVDVDPGVNDRGFAWARIDLPGTNDLFVISVHLKASGSASDASRRAAQAAQIRSLVQSNVAPGAFLIVAGDCNINDASEAALATFKSFLRDDPIPTDGGGDPDTNNSRAERYDYIFASASLHLRHVPARIGSRAYTNGLVFDSRRFTPLADVAPVLTNDSSGLQHMAVVKDFLIDPRMTNVVTMPAPRLQWAGTNILRWQGLAGFPYTVENSRDLSTWTPVGSAFSTNTNFAFTNSLPVVERRWFRVVFP